MAFTAALFPMLSTGFQVFSSIMQGQQQAAMHNYNASILNQNARIERQQADAREEAKRRETAMILGTQRAAFAQAGAGLDGSAADVMKQSATNAELDALTLRYEGDLRARGLKEQAKQEKYAAKTAITQSYFNTAGSILSGIGSYGQSAANAQYRSSTLAGLA